MNGSVPSRLLVPHGSVLGFDLGCRARGACRWHRSRIWFTCVEARIAVAGDLTVRHLPPNVPIPRAEEDRRRLAVEASRRHGTVYGYRRGCRSAMACPNFLTDQRTCTEARRVYVEDYHRLRTSSAGVPVEHGTIRGYNAGCHDEDRCPGNEDGQSCVEARRERRRIAAHHKGIASRDLVDASDAARILRAMQASGCSNRQIAQQCGVGRTVVGLLLAARSEVEPPRVTSSTRTRILVAVGAVAE